MLTDKHHSWPPPPHTHQKNTPLRVHSLPYLVRRLTFRAPAGDLSRPDVSRVSHGVALSGQVLQDRRQGYTCMLSFQANLAASYGVLNASACKFRCEETRIINILRYGSIPAQSILHGLIARGVARGGLLKIRGYKVMKLNLSHHLDC